MRTSRLLLRRPDADDAENLFAIYGDPRTNAYNPHGPYPNLDRAKTVLATWITHWEQHGFGQWAISSADQPEKIIGYGGLAFKMYGDKDTLNLGYRFGVDSWGNGYATEFATETLRYAFADLNAPDISALVRPLNTPSIRVLEKIGMNKIGILEDESGVPGGRYSLLYRAEHS